MDVCVSLQTVGVLTVAKASVSGIYRCVASNPSGSDHLDVHFYVTGDAETKMGKREGRNDALILMKLLLFRCI